jgi:hypothetical protein
MKRERRTFFSPTRLNEFTSGHIHSHDTSTTELQRLYQSVSKGLALAGDLTRFVIFYHPETGRVFYEWFPVTATFSDIRCFIYAIAPDLHRHIKFWDRKDKGLTDFADSDLITSVHTRAVNAGLKSSDNAGSGFGYVLFMTETPD